MADNAIARNPMTDHVRSAHRLRWIEATPWLIAIVSFFLLPDYMSLGTQIIITVLFALSLDLILGYAGIITLGHAAYFGVGAYACGMLSAHLGWTEPISALLAATLIAALVGWLSGLVLLRYHGLTLLMLTLSVAILLKELANANSALTGGFDGLTGIGFMPIFGLFEYDLWSHTHYWYALAWLAVVFVIARHIVHSPFGRSLVGIRENALRMHAVGAPVFRRQVAVYTLSAAIAGLSGALFAQTNMFVTLDVLSFARSGTIMIILILGGTGRLYGAFIGAVVYMVLEDELSKLTPEFWEFGVGLTLVFVVLFARNGILGVSDRVRSLLGSHSK
jgi:branched-chain amino acid transport system permease protein